MYDFILIIKKNTLPSLFEMLKLLVSCYLSFVLRNITTFNMHNLLPQYISKSLISIYSLGTYTTPYALTVVFIKSQDVIIIPNRRNEIKLSLGFCNCLFLIEKRMIFLIRLSCVIQHDGNFNDINLN